MLNRTNIQILCSSLSFEMQLSETVAAKLLMVGQMIQNKVHDSLSNHL